MVRMTGYMRDAIKTADNMDHDEWDYQDTEFNIQFVKDIN